jgi:membrane-associated protease RseP (regulator of RpoE activity)
MITMNRKVFRAKIIRATAWGLTLGLVALTGAARAEEDKEPRKVERHRVVVVDKDGKRQVFEGDGPMMRRGYLGVGLTELSPELRTHFGVPDDAGAMISSVEPGSPADKAGMRVGDILTSVDGHEVKSSWDVMAKVRRLDDGQQVPVEIWRNGKAQNLNVAIVVKERPELNMAPFFFKGGEDGKPMAFHWNAEEMKDFPKAFKMEGPEGERIRRLISSPREAELEKKLKELEKRIGELEKQLEKRK